MNGLAFGIAAYASVGALVTGFISAMLDNDCMSGVEFVLSVTLWPLLVALTLLSMLADTGERLARRFRK